MRKMLDLELLRAELGRLLEGKKNLSINELYLPSKSSSDLDIDIVDNGDGTFRIYYTVKDAGEYTLNIKFGGQPVPGGFYTFTVS